jgi:hypothetical protein
MRSRRHKSDRLAAIIVVVVIIGFRDKGGRTWRTSEHYDRIAVA